MIHEKLSRALTLLLASVAFVLSLWNVYAAAKHDPSAQSTLQEIQAIRHDIALIRSQQEQLGMQLNQALRIP